MQPETAEERALAHEQAVIERAYECLDAMRERTARALTQARRDATMTDAYDAAAIEHALGERLQAVAESKAPLTFGRIDEAGYGGRAGDRHYIGRRHVENDEGDPVVVDWRAPVSAPFYRATWADSQGLDRRSRFALDGRTLVGTFDEDFNDPDAAGGSGGVPDPLLAELDRGRTGAMRDIVATIQAEQDEIIRAPMNELIVVQGGPGTGKTAVGLHRAAYLLYAHRAEFDRRRLLVIGPNRLFLTYISQVLPSLGETAVAQGTIDSLTARSFPVRAEEERSVARTKGDARMATVIARAVFGRIAAADDLDALEVMTSFGAAKLGASVVASILTHVRERALATNVGRDVFREQLVAEAWRERSRRVDVNPEAQHDFVGDLRMQRGFKAYVDRVWPAMSAATIVRSLLGSRRGLMLHGAGIIDPVDLRRIERRAASRASQERWTRSDLALLDEANHLVTGDTPQFGHVVVDEAQDLSAMELRMVARRSPSRSITVLGDLAQATGAAASTSWEHALLHLGHGRVDGMGRERDRVEGRIAELTLGYRVPATLIAFANQLLPEAAPAVRPSTSVRDGGEPPSIARFDRGDLAREAAAVAVDLSTRWGVVGVLTAPSFLDEMLSSLTEIGAAHEDARRSGAIDDGITVVAAEAAKGLEFDAIVVVEPAMIAGDHADAGLRVLYVALTRATQQVAIVHSAPLPRSLRSGDVAATG